MTINEFIHVINEFKDYKEPQNIRIVCGVSEFFPPIQKYRKIDNRVIDIYDCFGYYAFTLDNKCSFNGSDTAIWRILVNNKIDVQEFFSNAKGEFSKSKSEQVSMIRLIYFLYFHEGIVLINRNKDKKMFEVFMKYNVTDVLFVGKSTPYKSLTKYFANSRIGVVYHPSRRVGKKKNWFYERLDSSAIDEVSFHNKKYSKTSFENFSISFFNK